MGALHEGHGSLMDASTAQNDITVVSIFVNPTQFGAGEDFSVYPRNSQKDFAFCEARGVDIIFAPEADEMYQHSVITVEPNEMGQILCGASRPGHFTGVCTVVAKLFHIVQPDHAYFGQKDAQQFFILEKMVKDLNFPLQMHACPIVREPDGLAMSSRNVYLSEDERKAALVLYRALQYAKEALQNKTALPIVLDEIRRMIAETPGVRLDYAEAVDLDGFTLTDRLAPRTLIALAVYFGNTRLIDNLIY